MIERRMRDFRLDTRLRKACEHDILTTCAYVGDPEAIDSAYDNSVADCLQVGLRGVGVTRATACACL
jgi:Golgi apparatus protein 1